MRIAHSSSAGGADVGAPELCEVERLSVWPQQALRACLPCPASRMPCVHPFRAPRAPDAGGAELDVSELGEVKGFKFDVLAARKPGLVQELMTFRDALLTSDEEEAIKVRLRCAPALSCV